MSTHLIWILTEPPAQEPVTGRAEENEQAERRTKTLLLTGTPRAPVVNPQPIPHLGPRRYVCEEGNGLNCAERPNGSHADADGGVLRSRHGKKTQDGANGCEYGEEDQAGETRRV